MRNEKGQKSNLICELACRTHDAEIAARVARVCREEQDDAIDDPGDVEDDDRRNGEERSKSQDHFIVKGAGQVSKLAKNKPDQEGKEAGEEQPEGHLLVASPLPEGEEGGHQEAAAQHDSLEDKGRVVYL